MLRNALIPFVIGPKHCYYIRPLSFGQNTIRTKYSSENYFFGQHLSHQAAKIAIILSDEYICPTESCPKLWLGVAHDFAVFLTKTNKEITETFLKEALI